nr:PQQ-binding-like beta-propeller repeat protein [uncultured Flavobacterium sp.]
MKEIYKALILIVVLFYCCKNEHKDSSKKIKLNASAKIFNDSLLVCSTLKDSIVIENIKNKKTVFSKKINDTEVIRPQPVLDKYNFLYAVFFENKLTCIDIKTNIVKWTYSSKEKINVIKSINDSLIIISIRGFGLVALNSQTGKVVYKLIDSGSSNCPTTFIIDFTYDKENLYVPDFQCNTITAFSLSTGEKRWLYGFDNYGPCKALIYGDFIFCGTTGASNNQGRIFVLNKNTGSLIFEDNSNQLDIITNPILYENKIIYSTDDNRLMAFNSHTKKSELLYKFNTNDGLCGGQLHLIDHDIYFDACEDNILKFNLKSKTLNKVGKVRKGLNEIYVYNNQLKFVY